MLPAANSDRLWREHRVRRGPRRADLTNAPPTADATGAHALRRADFGAARQPSNRYGRDALEGASVTHPTVKPHGSQSGPRANSQ